MCDGEPFKPKGSGLDDIGTSSFNSLDDGLTSLQWLQHFSNLSTVQHQLGSNRPTSPLAGNSSFIREPLSPEKAIATTSSKTLPLQSILTRGHCPDKVDYKTNADVKPPFSCATLICMAMQDSEQKKIPLSAIYKWISDNFCYYQHADPTWKNSVRHSLSLNKSFIKVPRGKGEPGKGAFWKVDPHYAEQLLSKAYRKTQMSLVQINTAPLPLPGKSDMYMSMDMESQQLSKEHLDWAQQGAHSG